MKTERQRDRETERRRDGETGGISHCLAYVLSVASFMFWVSSSIEFPPSLRLSVSPSQAQKRQFTIDATQSQITISLAQEGAIRRLHPSHTIAIPTYTSKLTLPKDESKTAFEIAVEAKSLINVDKTMGDFERKGFQNVLQKQVLESDKYPQIVFKAAGLTALKKDGEKRSFTLTGTLNFRGVARQVSFPVAATFSKDAITATGSAKFKQSDFGITPYADALGAIKVGDEMTVSFSVVAKSQ